MKFFVYGTLKVGGRFANTLKSKRLIVKKATTNGTLYNVGGNFPAAKFGGSSVIFGEIHTFKDEKNVLKQLDSIEGYHGKAVSNNLYNRVKITVEDVNGVMHNCVAYEFHQSTKHLNVISDGNWRI